MFEVGDLVKYINGESVYKVESIEDHDVHKLRHLKTNKIYNEGVPNRLIKLKFKIGDKVRILTKTKDDVVRIHGAYIGTGGLIYYTIWEGGTHYLETSLELVTEETPKFKKGDLVYVDPIKTYLSSHHYKVFQVLEVENKDILCSDPTLKKFSFREHFLFKFKFQPKDVVQVTNPNNKNFGKILVISHVSFFEQGVEYFSMDTDIWYKESELSPFDEYTIKSELTAKTVAANDNIDIQVVDGDIKINKSIFDNLEKQVSEIIDTYISNNNLNQNQNDENQLQREETSESGRSGSERVGVHGRRHQASIRIRHQCNEAGLGKSSGHSIRVKEQLSTSYSRPH